MHLGDPVELRRTIPLIAGEKEPPIHYLDNMTAMLAPRFVLDAMLGYCTEVGSIPIRSGGGRAQHALGDRAARALFQARAQVAELIHAKATEIVFVESSVVALNMLSQMLQLTTGAQSIAGEVVTHEGEHYDNLLPWTARGGRPAIVKVGPDGEPSLDDYEAHLDGARLATISHVSHVTGAIRPVEAFAAACRSAGALSLVDASHSIGRMPIDVQRIGCDFMVFSSHNLLCPPGAGVLYVREGIADEIVPSVFGGGGVNRVDAGGNFFVLSDRPFRFEPGPVNIPGAIGLGAAAEAMRSYGMERIRVRDRALRQRILETLRAIPGIRVLGPSECEGAGIVSFATDVSKLFANDHLNVILSDRFRVIIRAGCLHAIPALHRLSTGEAGCVSTAPYTHEVDIDALGEALSTIQRPFMASGTEGRA